VQKPPINREVFEVESLVSGNIHRGFPICQRGLLECLTHANRSILYRSMGEPDVSNPPESLANIELSIFTHTQGVKRRLLRLWRRVVVIWALHAGNGGPARAKECSRSRSIPLTDWTSPSVAHTDPRRWTLALNVDPVMRPVQVFSLPLWHIIVSLFIRHLEDNPHAACSLTERRTLPRKYADGWEDTETSVRRDFPLRIEMGAFTSFPIGQMLFSGHSATHPALFPSKPPYGGQPIYLCPHS